MKDSLRLVARLINFMKKLLPVILLAVFFAVFGFLITVYIPAKIISLGFDAVNGEKLKIISLIILVVLAISRGLFRYGEHYFGHYVAFKVLADFRREIFSKLRRLAPSKLDSQDSGALLKLIGEDVEALEVFFAHTLAPITTGTIVSIILIIYYLQYNILLALIAVIVYFTLAVIIPNIFSNKLKPHLEVQQKYRKSYTSYFLESLRGMKDLLQLGVEKERFKNLSKESRIVNKKERNVAKLNFLQFSYSFLTIGFGVLAFAFVDFILVNKNVISVKGAVITLVVFSSSFAPFLELSRLPLGLGRALQAAKQTFSLLDENEPLGNDGSKEIEKINEIKFENVDFSYPKRDKMIFENLNLHFEDEKIVGLVGESGSGKSTLMKIVMKWYMAKSGKISLNEEDILEIDSRKLQEKIAYIPQFPQIFSQTIRENLVLGNDKITDEEILEIAEKCRLKDVILSTENGLDTKINSEKIIFSSGEMQRLELMRALLKRADVYIFDEPTSNLDTLNESIILNLIKENCKGMVFLISHRMSTVSFSDIVYRVENGKCFKI
ncbi:ABC transporter ATP-binding protein [Parvimonas micra]|uniref:ABC transporter ATP-binding protein/permease n=1 Tax=Parvimonas micra TaxID=33033 RepID=A0A9X3HBH7_9FIRM|nr:ABC transporter ATP-binding protein [Parvimonas micra]MCZ7407839.1 ABC transporter ATP-binding protein/permease [Parvimonas micra]MCZ7410471.1 ABC transporter ATP-binding protein/permease [Parvimonas micra]MCZ7412331.1 ABC transporter ATP-binding protein/permease [Parvimonas micra]WBB36593.1 ABC transporter ATP-binding protein/permease [Parvimonas micra]